jgi:DNA-binding cell septation regulator SpoVG
MNEVTNSTKIIEIEWFSYGEKSLGQVAIRSGDIVIRGLKIVRGKYGVFLAIPHETDSRVRIVLPPDVQKRLSLEVRKLLAERTTIAKPKLPSQQVEEEPTNPTDRYMAWKQKARQQGSI